MKSLNTILLVEDDKTTRFMLREQLEKNDFIILEACAGRRCLEIIEQYPVNLILLDLNLPDGNGFDFIDKIKAQTDVPLIILSSEKDEDKRVESFEIGADDFVSKPFNSKVLIARIKAHIRRYDISHNTSINMKRNGKESNISHFHGWTLDRLKYELHDKDGQAAALTQKEFYLLDYIVLHPDRVLKRDELCEVIRENNYVPTPRAIDVKITRIRKKIGDNALQPFIIKTVRGVGYIFNPDTESG